MCACCSFLLLLFWRPVSISCIDRCFICNKLPKLLDLLDILEDLESDITSTMLLICTVGQGLVIHMLNPKEWHKCQGFAWRTYPCAAVSIRWLRWNSHHECVAIRSYRYIGPPGPTMEIVNVFVSLVWVCRANYSTSKTTSYLCTANNGSCFTGRWNYQAGC